MLLKKVQARRACLKSSNCQPVDTTSISFIYEFHSLTRARALSIFHLPLSYIFNNSHQQKHTLLANTHQVNTTYYTLRRSQYLIRTPSLQTQQIHHSQ